MTELEKMATDAMEKWRGKNLQNDHLHPWVGYKEGFLAGAAEGRRQGIEESVKLCGACGGTGEVSVGSWDEPEKDDCPGCDRIRALLTPDRGKEENQK